MKQLTLSILLLFISCSHQPTLRYAVQATPEERGQHESFGQHGVISTQGEAATIGAKKIIARGGNLVDALIAASFLISVERPQSTGLSGGGFLLFRNGETKKIYAMDFRERAPINATTDMFLDSNKKIIPGRSTNTIFGVATPGLVRGLFSLHKSFGTIPWNELIQPAIDLAKNGFKVYPHLANAIVNRKDILLKNEEAKKLFFQKDGAPLKVGDTLIQKDLATTLERIAQNGEQEFIDGETAQKIVNETKRLGGILTLEDFKYYQTHLRMPVTSTYHGLEIYSMPPPSSGGTHVIEILNMLENDNLEKLKPQTTESVHLISQSFQQAFLDRAQYMGDSDFAQVPLEKLTSKEYAKIQRQKFNQTQSRHPEDLKKESNETTHISMMDDRGNMIASTQTINGYFGSGIVVPKTGIVLNNEMDDFTAQIGASNLFGAVGGKNNLIEPKKTPLSSMSPTLILKDNNPVMSLGAPGGSRIITCVAQTILNYFDFKLSLYDSIAAVRFHHQYSPDELMIDEYGLDPKVELELTKMNYKLNKKKDAVLCRVMATAKEENGFHGVSDPRDAGISLAW